MVAKLFHPLLVLIASATNRELAHYIQYLKEENKILRARIPRQIHTKPSERERLLKFGKRIGKAIEKLITIVSPSTFYRWIHNEDQKKEVKNPKSGQRKGMPDGLKVNDAGILIVTAPGGVWVFTPQGKHLGTIHCEQFASNVAFGPNQKSLYITADMLLLRIRLN
jgi:SMP-30/Gluconolactonase/LRE-like region